MGESPSRGTNLGQNPYGSNPYYPSQNAGAVQAGNPLFGGGGGQGQSNSSGASSPINPAQMQQLQTLFKSIVGRQGQAGGYGGGGLAPMPGAPATGIEGHQSPPQYTAPAIQPAGLHMPVTGIGQTLGATAAQPQTGQPSGLISLQGFGGQPVNYM